MPHANIWIRKKNEAKWNAMEDKSDFVNTMLEEQPDAPNWNVITPKEVVPQVEEEPEREKHWSED